MKTEKTSRSMSATLLGIAVFFLAFGCSASKEPSVKQSPTTAAELRAETARRDASHYETGVKIFVATQERIMLYTREEAERREVRREHDTKKFWEKQQRTRQ